jgi:hypothetical protein
MSIRDKNLLELHNSTTWVPYCVLVRCFGNVHKFLEVLKKILSFGSNPKWLAFGFTEKCLFVIKIGRKSAFHPREAPILTRLDITVLYIVVWGFWKILSFGQKPKEVSFWFYKKMYVCDENWPKICISSPWGPYFCSVRHYGVVHNFSEVLKNIKFRLKTQRELLVLSKNVCSWWKRVKNPYFILVGPIFFLC